MLTVIDRVDHRIAIFVLAALSFFYLLVGYKQGLNIFDEALVPYGATRILNGEVIYRDFWSIYAPAQFYLLAGLFKLFGTSITVARISSIAILTVLSVTIYYFAQKLASRKAALLSWMIFVFWMGPGPFWLYPIPASIIFSLISALCLMNFIYHSGRRWLVLGGLLAGFSTLFRHDVGMYTFTAEGVVLIAFVMVGGLLPKEKIDIQERIRGGIRAVRYYLLGASAILVPVAVYFACVVPTNELWYDLIVFPARILPRVRRLPYPLPIPDPARLFRGQLSFALYTKAVWDRSPYYFPLMVFAIAIAWIITQIHKRWTGRSQIEPWNVALVLLLGLLFFNQARIRADIIHLLPTIIPAAILYPMLLFEIPRNVKNDHVRRFCFIFIALLPLPTVSKPIVEKYDSLIGSNSPMFSFDIDRARGIYWDCQGVAYQSAIKYIQAQVPKGERIFVGNTRHDRVLINDIMFYFLSNRHSATKYHELLPGLVTTVTVQEKIVSDIKSHHVRYIVLRSERIQESIDKNESGVSSGVYILDNFIREYFTQVETFGDYTVWRWKVQ